MARYHLMMGMRHDITRHQCGVHHPEDHGDMTHDEKKRYEGRVDCHFPVIIACSADQIKVDKG